MVVQQRYLLSRGARARAGVTLISELAYLSGLPLLVLARRRLIEWPVGLPRRGCLTALLFEREKSHLLSAVHVVGSRASL